MKRKWLAALCLLCAAAMLTACSGGGQPQSNQVFTEVTQYLGPTATATETPVPVNTDLTGVRSKEQFPNELRDYITFLEKELQVPIKYVGVGPDREQIIEM